MQEISPTGDDCSATYQGLGADSVAETLTPIECRGRRIISSPFWGLTLSVGYPLAEVHTGLYVVADETRQRNTD